MHRFFCANIDINSPTVFLENPSEIHHLKDVLRIKMGDQVRLFDNNSHEIVGTILSIKPERIQVRRDYLYQSKSKIGPKIILACAVPKKSKFELIIEKATELGIDEIIPLVTKRTQFSLKAERHRSKVSRYQNIALNAAKQSQRNSIPQIQSIQNLTNTLNLITGKTLGLIGCLDIKRKSLIDIQFKFKQVEQILLLIGPEGDFTPDEVEQALSAGCIPVSLGQGVLKVDTAAITMVSYVNLVIDHNFNNIQPPQ